MSQFMDMIIRPNYQLGVAKRQFRNITSEHKFGAVPAMSQNNTGTIWDVNDTTYPWSTFDTAGTLSVPAVNASDDDKKLTIVGLDSNYAELTEEVTLDSSAAVTTTNSFIRVFRAYISDGAANVAAVEVQKDSTVVAKLNAGKAQTLMAIYTVPAGKSAYILKGTATCQDGADATGDMFIRYFGQTAFRVGHSFEVCGDGGQYMYDFGIPIRIPEKSDIDIRASVRSNNARLTAAFDLLLNEE